MRLHELYGVPNIDLFLSDIHDVAYVYRVYINNALTSRDLAIRRPWRAAFAIWNKQETKPYIHI